MKEQEAKNYLNRKIKLILTNGFHYTGIVLNVLEDTLTIKDKFSNSVSIKLSNIMVFEEILNGEY